MSCRPPCTFPDCDHPIDSGGFCTAHRSQRSRTGTMWPLWTRSRRMTNPQEEATMTTDAQSGRGANQRLSEVTRTIGGTNKSGPGGVQRTVSPGPNRQESAMDQLTHTKTIVRKVAGTWHVTCPCGFVWTSHFHRLALMLAAGHIHMSEVA